MEFVIAKEFSCLTPYRGNMKLNVTSGDIIASIEAMVICL